MNVSITLETKKELNKIIGSLQAVTGKKYSYDEAIGYIVKNSITIDEEMKDALKTIKTFYNLTTNEEIMRLMVIRFHLFVKDMKEKGYDKFNLIP